MPKALSILVLVLVASAGCVVEVRAPGSSFEGFDEGPAPAADVDDDTDPDLVDDAPDPVEPTEPSEPTEPNEPALDDDDAAILTATLPGSIVCGESAVVSVSVENRGSLAWTRETHKLGAVNDSDPLFGPDPRVYLPAGVVVATGERFSFEFTLQAVNAGVVTTDWQMVHEGVRWFGETVSAQVVVECDEPAVDVEPEPEPSIEEQFGSPPDMSSTVRDLANERPDLLAASCVNAGGNNDFLHALVDRLRQTDNRWGYNWKRGNIGDMSQDVVDYYYGVGDPSEDSSEVFIIDVIGDHCGNARPAFTDVTQATRDGGTIGRWTSLNRF
ncbi:MAG: hypothetical protein Q8O67_13410 [Deltaproteobacteria bacterium]|nr:hypothetical protein [Deltaproteobacteria bacterium]